MRQAGRDGLEVAPQGGPGDPPERPGVAAAEEVDHVLDSDAGEAEQEVEALCLGFRV